MFSGGSKKNIWKKRVNKGAVDAYSEPYDTSMANLFCENS